MVVAVTHVSVMRAAIVYALQAEPRSFWHIDIAPLSLVRLSGHGGRWTLVSVTSAKPTYQAKINSAKIGPNPAGHRRASF